MFFLMRVQFCKHPACPPATADDGLQVKVTPKHYSSLPFLVRLYIHLDLKPVTSDFIALQPQSFAFSSKTEAPAAPCSSSVYNPGSISTPSPHPITRLHTHCQLQAEFFSSAPTPAYPRASTESTEQCERSDSLSA